MKKQYQTPFLQSVRLADEDVLTLSILLINDEDSEKRFDYKSILEGRYHD